MESGAKTSTFFYSVIVRFICKQRKYVMKIKRIFAILLVCVFTFFAAGCVPYEEEKPDGSNPWDDSDYWGDNK